MELFILINDGIMQKTPELWIDIKYKANFKWSTKFHYEPYILQSLNKKFSTNNKPILILS